MSLLSYEQTLILIYDSKHHRTYYNGGIAWYSISKYANHSQRERIGWMFAYSHNILIFYSIKGT